MQSEENGIITLIDYDMNETKNIDENQLQEYKPLGIHAYSVKSYISPDKWIYVDEISCISIPKTCFKLLSYIDIDIIKCKKISADEMKDDKCYCHTIKAIRPADKYGVVWEYGSTYTNILKLLLHLESEFGIDLADYNKLVLYSKDYKDKYIISFNDKFKSFISKIRFMKGNE